MTDRVPDYIFRIVKRREKQNVERPDSALFGYALCKENASEEDIKILEVFIAAHPKLEGEELLQTLIEFCEQA